MSGLWSEQTKSTGSSVEEFGNPVADRRTQREGGIINLVNNYYCK